MSCRSRSNSLPNAQGPQGDATDNTSVFTPPTPIVVNDWSLELAPRTRARPQPRAGARIGTGSPFFERLHLGRKLFLQRRFALGGLLLHQLVHLYDRWALWAQLAKPARLCERGHVADRSMMRRAPTLFSYSASLSFSQVTVTAWFFKSTKSRVASSNSSRRRLFSDRRTSTCGSLWLSSCDGQDGGHQGASAPSRP